MKRICLALIVLTGYAAAGVSASLANANPGSLAKTRETGMHEEAVTWQDIAVAFTWPVLRPVENLGLHLRRLDVFAANCDSNNDYQAYTASYGTPRGRSFSLYVGKGFLCGDGPESAVVGHVVIRGHRATVYVPLFGTSTPTLSDGYRHGISLYWKQGGTAIDISATHVHLADLVRVARQLKAVSG